MIGICHADSHGLDVPEPREETVSLVPELVQINWLYIYSG